MSLQASFTLRGRNPDVLTCIANLSNDEVFTPPELANRMLDTLTEAWAKNHNGANLWADKSVTFLDPCTKSGVFLREITRRLAEGLEKEIPDLQKRVNHILTKQVFGIAITRITSLLARRSVYCSKHAQGKHSIAITVSLHSIVLFFNVRSRKEAMSLQSYYTTRFFRFLVSLRKITQHATHSTYTWVPMQKWDRTWTDEALFKKYGITKQEQAYIESQVRPMNLDENEDE